MIFDIFPVNNIVVLKVENQPLGPRSTSRGGDVWPRESLKEHGKAAKGEGTGQSVEDFSKPGNISKSFLEPEFISKTIFANMRYFQH